MSAVRRFWMPGLALIAIVAGVVTLLTTPTSFGWFAYAPLSQTAYLPPLIQQQAVVGWVLIAAGTVVLAGWLGYLVGRRGSTRG